jgi:hypothetical protein
MAVSPVIELVVLTLYHGLWINARGFAVKKQKRSVRMREQKEQVRSPWSPGPLCGCCGHVMVRSSPALLGVVFDPPDLLDLIQRGALRFDGQGVDLDLSPVV